MAVLQELKRVKQHVEQLESVKRLRGRLTEDVLDGAVRKESCTLKFMHPLVVQLVPEYVGLVMSVAQQFGSCCSREGSAFRHFRDENFQEWEWWARKTLGCMFCRKEIGPC